MNYRYFLLLLVVLSFPTLSFAEEAESQEKSKEPIPEILDVEERTAEMSRFEFTPYSGFYLGDTLNSSYMFGGLFDVRLLPELSVGVDFAWSPISFDPQGSFGQTVTNKNEYIIQGVVTINVPAAFFQNGKVFEADFFTTIGGGVMRINNSYRGSGFLGGGMMTYFPWVKWLGFRVEVRGYFSSVLTTNGTDFTTDVTITGGPTFLIPPRLF